MADSPATPIPRLALPALLIANVVLACGPWLVRLSQTESGIGPVAAGFWRLTLALPVLLIAARRIEHFPPRAGSSALLMVAIAGLAFAADLGLWHVGILHTRLANATLLGNITALLFPLYGFAVARLWPRPRQWLALLLATAGAILLVGRSYELSGKNFLGDLLCIAAGCFYTLYLIALDRVRGAVPPLSTLAISVLTGAPLLLLFAFGLGEPIWPKTWLPLLLLAGGSQLIGQGLILYAVSRVPPIVVGLMLLTQPIVAATIGWLVYGEALTLVDAIGAVGIAVAVLLVRDRPAKALPHETHGLSSVL
ncbi:DMT family transporter [Sphingomonas sp. BIUV-7]|uniref:DMT family transporter n=1 Tax=Sphingomonas natans TaxID=3063330 RepID=A0ABT8YD98_9SPHN|nr:DMT family transporter [Sphingomonas sp. BIUV-7]MDO6416318.1 DMT family transporter [Sphingomonas sp. BIUV-7]